MTTSGVTQFTMTARDLVIAALDESSIIPLGEMPEDTEMQKCILRLNGMIKSWQMRGVVWKQETITITVPAQTKELMLPDYVREVNGARTRLSNSEDRQMSRWERDDYLVLPNKSSIGSATMYMIEQSPNAVKMYVWPVPDKETEYVLDIDRKMDTVTEITQNVDVPEELLETVYTNLALRCVGIFGQQPTQELVFRAQNLEALMLDNYRPASYTMEAW